MRFLKTAGGAFVKTAGGAFVKVDETHAAGFNPCGTPCDCSWIPSVCNLTDFTAKTLGTAGTVQFNGSGTATAGPCSGVACSAVTPQYPTIEPWTGNYSGEQGTGFCAFPYNNLATGSTALILYYCTVNNTAMPGSSACGGSNYLMTAGKWYWKLSVNVKCASNFPYGKRAYGEANVALSGASKLVASAKNTIASCSSFGGDTTGCDTFTPTFSIA